MNNTILNPGVGGDQIATEDIGGVKYELVKVVFGVDGSITKVSAADPLPVTDNAAEVSLASIDLKLAPSAAIINGKTTVVAAGTSVPLAGSTPVKSVTIKAMAANTGLIYVGNATVSSSNGFELSAGDSISMDVSNLSTVNIDSDNNGEGVSYLAIN